MSFQAGVMRRAIRAIFIFILIIPALSCEDLPRDQKETTRRITQSGKLRVGLIENPPWVIRTMDEPKGAEVELVRQFASEIGAKPEWTWGGEEKLLGALENYELDLVAGGLSDKTPWKNRIGMTGQFFKETFDVGTRPNGASVKDLKDREIVVNDSRTAGFVREKDALPVQTDELSGSDGRLVAAPTWELEKLGLSPTGNDLHTDRHIVATPPGENQLVKRLDEFFSRQKDNIPALLQQQSEVASR